MAAAGAACRRRTNLKRSVAQAAIRFIKDGEIIGVGTGSTADCFIDELAALKQRIAGAVPSSERSAIRLAHHGIRLFDLNDVESLSVYVDGADQIDAQFSMIKGGGGALTREKIVAAVAQTFVCIADESKKVDVLGGFPLPVEVVPIARAYVMRELAKYGTPKLRSGFTTDNGNVIIDVHGLQIDDAACARATHRQHRRRRHQRAVRRSRRRHSPVGNCERCN